jgi:hypothetical protein
METKLTESKATLARLMATENITVQHLNVSTASFDLHDRVLTCPIWNDMTGDLYDLLMGHEVGHALYTPMAGWHDAVEPRGTKYKGFLNVIEDIRIEKLIRRKYPGLRKSFYSAYRTFLDKDMFGIAKYAGNYNQLLLIDRMNLSFKCGTGIDISFSEEEQVFIKEAEKLETWADVIVLTNKIWEFSKKNETMPKPEPKKQQPKMDASPDAPIEEHEAYVPEPDEEQEEGSGQEQADSEEESDEESDEEGKSKKSEESEETDEEEEKSDSGEGEESDEEEAEQGKEHQTSTEGGQEAEETEESDEEVEPESVTDGMFRASEADLVNRAAMPHVYFDLPKTNLDSLIVPNKKIVSNFEGAAKDRLKRYSSMDYKVTCGELSRVFIKRNSKYISLLVKEFEMRKNATQYTRSLESKSGDLDTRRLARYRYSNDIFRKISEVQKGKSHGMVMFLDMSSSMSRIIGSTVEQILILTTFCKRVGIPFEVYGFCDLQQAGHTGMKFSDITPNSFKLASMTFHLKELITSNTSGMQYKRAFDMLLFYSYTNYYNLNNDSKKVLKHYHSTGGFGLGGTPFIETIVASREIIERLKRKANLDIINVIYLTDGEGANSMISPKRWEKYTSRNCNLGIIDPITKKKIAISPTDGNATQTALTQLMRNITGANHIGFYVGTEYNIDSMIRHRAYGMFDSNRNGSSATAAEKKYIEEQNAKLKADGYLNMPTLGYDNYYYLAVNNDMDDKLVVTDNQSSNAVFNSFMASQKKKQANRALVSNFAKNISVQLQ